MIESIIHKRQRTLQNKQSLIVFVVESKTIRNFFFFQRNIKKTKLTRRKMSAAFLFIIEEFLVHACTDCVCNFPPFIFLFFSLSLFLLFLKLSTYHNDFMYSERERNKIQCTNLFICTYHMEMNKEI